MRCFICDVAIENIQYNSDHEDFEPCETCKAVIQDTLEGYIDTPSAPEDAWLEPEPELWGGDYDNDD